MQDRHLDFYIKFGLNVAYYRKLKGMTQETLAELSYTAEPNHISLIETGKVGISFDKLFDISKALEIEPSKLLEFRD